MTIIVGNPGQGGAGPVSTVQRYARVHTQDEALTVWVIQHDLGYDPAGITVVDELNNVHHPLIEYLTANSIIKLNFETPVRGVCRLS